MKENIKDEWWGHFCEALGDHTYVYKGEMCSWCNEEERLTPDEIKKKEGDELLEIIKNLEDGKKYDSEKPMLYLLPPRSLIEIGKVLTHGAEKYGPENWRKLDDLQNRYTSAALRHIVAHMEGEKCDKETNLSHLAHAMCCLLFKLEDELIEESEEAGSRETHYGQHYPCDKSIIGGTPDNEEGSVRDFKYKLQYNPFD